MKSSALNCRRFHRWLAAASPVIHRQLTAAGAFQSFICVFQPLMMCQQQISIFKYDMFWKNNYCRYAFNQ